MVDRLEKALEKAKQERGDQPVGAAGAPPVAVARTVPRKKTGGPAVNEALFEKNRIVAHRTRNAEADVYRQLRAKVLHIMNASGYKTLAITSPRYGDGKTTVAINLGISITLDVNQTVLMVDLDLRKPSMAPYLGLSSTGGLTDYLNYDTPIGDLILKPPFERLSVLPVGVPLDHSSEMLASPKMGALTRELKSRYPDRLVIFDMPPVLAQDDPITFLPKVDAVLVVVRDGVTKSDDLRRCLRTLKNVNVIGTVLNNCW